MLMSIHLILLNKYRGVSILTPLKHYKENRSNTALINHLHPALSVYSIAYFVANVNTVSSV